MKRLISFFVTLIIFTCISKLACQEEVNEIGLDNNEKDKILTCSELVSRRHQMDAKIIEDLTNGFGPQKEIAVSKISAEMMSLCYNKISDEVVKTIFNNLTYYEFDWSEELNKLVKIDYSKYRAVNDLELTPEQQILFYKYEKAKDDFMVVNRQRQEKAAKSLPPIFGIDINEISPTVKIIYTLVVFTLFMAGIVYLLGRVNKKEDKKKKKRN